MGAPAAVLRLRVRRRLTAPWLATAVLLAGWTAVAAAALAGRVPSALAYVLVFGVPLALGLRIAFGRRPARDETRLAALWTGLIAASLVAGIVVIASPLIALIVPAALITAIVCNRWPAGSVVVLFGLTGFFQTISLYVPVIPSAQLVDLLLMGLWLAAAWRYLFSGRERSLWIWPGVGLTLLYVVATVAAVAQAESTFNGFHAFRIATWYMLAFVIIAYAGWERETYRKIARGFIVVAAAVGAYATLRWIIGPSGEEARGARLANPVANFLDGELRLVGSFPSGHDLSAWTAVMIPFAVGAALAFRGAWRIVAIAGAVLCGIALLGSEVRVGALAAVAGIAVALPLYQLSRGFRGLHLGTTIAAILLLVGGAVVVFSITAGADEGSQSRYESLLDPTDDPSYKARVFKWENALDDIGKHPFGQGLGTAGKTQQTYGRFQNIGSSNVDSGYLKIALDQGFFVMGLFIAAMLLIVWGLARRAVFTTVRERAGLAIGACGTLVAMLVLLSAGVYQEGLTALTAWMLVGLGLAQFSLSRPAPHPDA